MSSWWINGDLWFNGDEFCDVSEDGDTLELDFGLPPIPLVHSIDRCALTIYPEGLGRLNLSVRGRTLNLSVGRLI